VVKVGPEGAEKIAVFKQVTPLWKTLIVLGLIGQVEFDLSVVRGLAYYTGTVFELIAPGERAICGGGRYDGLIELFGGPATPAVGFGMGDVVLSLLLEEKGLIPEGDALADAASRRPASVRPEVFAISADDERTDPSVLRLVTDLRRGVRSQAHRQRDGAKPWDADRYSPAGGGVRPMHARLTYKSTRNLKKLLADAERQRSRLAAVVHGVDRVELRDLDERTRLTPADIAGMPADVAEFSVDPRSPVYVGRAAVRVLRKSDA
jgi:histidyl-tRNA synthetase